MNTHLLAFFLIFAGWGDPPGEAVVETATPNAPNGSQIDEIAAPVQPASDSFEQTCRDIVWSGVRVCAFCQTIDGGERHTCIDDVGNCSGDISNQNGLLVC